MSLYASIDCEEHLAKAINLVGHSFDEDQGYNLGSKKKSPFTLLRKNVDAPFKEILLKYKNHKLYPRFRSITPSKMGKCDHPDLSSYFDEKISSIKQWDNYLRYLCSNENLPQEVFHAFDSVRVLINLFCSRKPKISKALTYCKYCWRLTLYESKSKNILFEHKEISRYSKKYCEIHSLAFIEYHSNNKLNYSNPNYRNYINGKRYAKEFSNEVNLEANPHIRQNSKFSFLLTFLFGDKSVKLPDTYFPSDQEIRKLIHDLVYSRMYSDKRLAILYLLLQGFNVKEICLNLNIKKSSTYDSVNFLKTDFIKKVRCMFLQEATEENIRKREILISKIKINLKI